jgi:hypothetical protein
MSHAIGGHGGHGDSSHGSYKFGKDKKKAWKKQCLSIKIIDEGTPSHRNAMLSDNQGGKGVTDEGADDEPLSAHGP